MDEATRLGEDLRAVVRALDGWAVGAERTADGVRVDLGHGHVVDVVLDADSLESLYVVWSTAEGVAAHAIAQLSRLPHGARYLVPASDHSLRPSRERELPPPRVPEGGGTWSVRTRDGREVRYPEMPKDAR